MFHNRFPKSESQQRIKYITITSEGNVTRLEKYCRDTEKKTYYLLAAGQYKSFLNILFNPFYLGKNIKRIISSGS